MKVYVLKTSNVCECEPSCSSFCVGYTIEDVYFDKSEAEKRAKELYCGFVDEYTVKGGKP